ncbi:MAG: hypothetical protein ACTSQY_10005 [Candidatus Odinarchaeia archaeon]
MRRKKASSTNPRIADKKVGTHLYIYKFLNNYIMIKGIFKKKEIPPEAYEAEGQRWPTEAVAEQIKKIGVTKRKSWGIKPTGFKDVTKEEGDLAKKFLPKVVLAGRNLHSEVEEGFWGGILFRVLASKAKDERCIQYIYLWTQQQGLLNFWFAVAPLFLLAWIAYVFIVASTTVLELLVVSTIIGLFFIIAGLKPAFQAAKHRDKNIFVLTNDSWFILWGLLFMLFIGVFEITAFSPYIVGWTPLIFLILGFGMLILWAFRNRIKFGVHEMDYQPIFIYLTKEKGEWQISMVRFDVWHYKIQTARREELIKGNFLEKKDGKEIVKIIIDNNWHSMRLMKTDYKIVGIIAAAIFIFFIADTILAVVTSIIFGVDYGFSVLYFLIGDLVFLIGPIIFWVAALVVYTFSTKELPTKDFDPKDSRYHLTQEKLVVLWNLAETEAKLISRHKIQDPFNEDEEFWASFRDDILLIIQYSLLPHINALESKLKTLEKKVQELEKTKK